MRKGIRKLISFTLLAALLLQLLPVSVFATEEESAISGDDILSNEQEPAAAEDLAGGDNLQDAEILFEETSLREENVKHSAWITAPTLRFSMTRPSITGTTTGNGQTLTTHFDRLTA